MAQGAPTYDHGAVPEREAGEFFQHTLGQLYWDDDDELNKVGQLARAYDKRCKIDDVAGLLEATNAQHALAISAVYAAAEVDGVKKKILRYLGAQGTPHVPPEEQGA